MPPPASPPSGSPRSTKQPVPLRDLLKNLCDIVRSNPIVNDKMLAYAYILTHEGYPCVFWQDYYNWDLAQPANASGIDALVKLHESNAGGATVHTRRPDTTFRPAWRGHDNTDTPEPKITSADGSSDFWAPPRGYTVYLP